MVVSVSLLIPGRNPWCGHPVLDCAMSSLPDAGQTSRYIPSLFRNPSGDPARSGL